MSPNHFKSWLVDSNELSVLDTGSLNDNHVSWDVFGVREILIKSLKLIKVYFKEIKNKINPWFI